MGNKESNSSGDDETSYEFKIERGRTLTSETMVSPNNGPNIDCEIELQLKELQLVDVSKTGKVIGKGSYGQVIEVFVHGTLCAAKEIYPMLIMHDDAGHVKRSFQIECVKSSQIFHPNVVQVLGIYYPTPRPVLPWLVMELMDISLKGLIDKSEKIGIPLHFKLSILIDVAHGLEFLHTKDIVHRDLSSNNILLTKQLVAKIADLGMAKVIDRNKVMTLTQTPGTLHFMPPEALASKPRYGAPVDVFSLACVVLHLMSCKWPEPKDRVVEKNDSLVALTEVQRRDEYLESTIPTLKSLITKCLHNKPEQRPKISEVCVMFKELKANTDKQIPFATANNIELFEEVCQGHQQKRSVETALRNAESSLAKEKSRVSELEATNAVKDQQLQQCHDRYKKLLEAEKTQVTQLEDFIKEKSQQLHNAKLQVQKYKEGASQTHQLTTLIPQVGVDGLKQRSIIEILWNSLADKPYVSQTTTNKVMATQLPSLDDTQNEVRYKLIIDPSEDESITRLLFMFGILKRDNTHTYLCSDFLGDGQLQKINTIAAIRHSAIAGHTVIMSQTDDIHESSFDLFNRHFHQINNPEVSPRYFTNIAIGANPKPSRVDQKFHCIVVVRESEIKDTLAPFLNKFEKYYISHTNLLNLVLEELPPCLKAISNVVYKKVEAFYSLLDEGSFYGGNKETVCSLLLSILPKPGHKYKPITLSFVATDSEGDHDNFTGGLYSVITEGSSNKVLLLQNIVRRLHELGGFCYMETSQRELEHDANCIIDLLAKTGLFFSGVAKTLGSCDVSRMLQWIAEAMDLIYTGEAPPDIDTTDYNTCDDDDDHFKTLGASDGACMVTAVIAQWLVRYLCKKLMQLMTPEAAILKRKSIPISYLETYLNYQSHFSIKELITRQSELLNQCGDGKIATKLICYTRSTPLIDQLPAMYPRTTFSSAEELRQSNGHIEDLICDKADNVFLCKLSTIPSQTAFELALEASQQRNVFVLIINMQDTSRLIINHIRIMIEEAESAETDIKKLFVLLLHFPAMMFYDPCYPSLFLHGWDHYYLDAIDRTNKFTLVDTREWFRQSCLSVKGTLSSTATDEIQSLLCLLSKQESILVIASRILLNIDSNEVSLESLPDIATKANYLKKLLFHKKVAYILCLKFKSYWRPSVMGDHLEQAAKFAKSRESTLNVSDSVNSIYRSSFFNFIAYMIYQMSKGHNLDMLFNDHCDDAALDLFLKLLDVHPIPKLSEIKAFNNTWDCRIHTAGKSGYIPQFPFFVKVSGHICKMVEQSVAEINNSDDILQEKTKPEVVDLQSKEQMLKKLYEHLCDKSSAIIKAEKTVGEKYMSAIAIKEMGNDDALWQKYFNDFTHQYLHLSTTAPDNIENKLVQLTFTDVLRKYSVMKAIAVHCFMLLYQLDLAKIVALLKPLGQLEELKLNEQSLYPGDPQCSLVTTLQTSALGSSRVSKFVIDSLFSILVNVIYSRDEVSRLSLLQKWYNSYRDMILIASLKSMLMVTMLTEQLKTQHHLMKVTFLILESFHHITDVAAECAHSFACYLCNKCFDEKYQFKGDVSLNLKEIVSSFHIMLHSPQFTQVVSVSQLYQHIMEGLFSHFFPNTGDSKAVYSKEDIKFFLTFANEQDKQKAYNQTFCQDDQSANSISLSKFKFHLDRILCKGWSKSEIVAQPLTFYKLEVCLCVGETILSQHPETSSLSEYVPLYLQQATKNDHLKLMHLYFYTVLERLHTCQFSPKKLVKMVTDTERKFTEGASSKAENLLAVVERQALLEALLQSIVSNFDLENKTKLSNLSMTSDQINALVNDQSHYDILLMHLMKKHHGVQGVLSVLAEKHRKLWEPFGCLKKIKESLKGSPPSTVHQFPFIVGGPTNEHQFNIIYRDLCNQLHGIAPPGSLTARAKNFVLSIVNSSDKSYDGKSVVRMMIWLCVYYEYYCKKKQGANLMKFFREMDRDLELSKEHLNVLNCFLDCNNMMMKVEEVPNPLDPNAEVLEYTKDGKIKPKQPPSNAPKSDPIWEFFIYRSAREDPSDVNLRNALANMIAVVFGLPSYSTHLWYHMFSPGELENSYLTGFMYPKVVKRGTLMYECGCELNEDGNYGRSDYSSRDTLSLHSWYLLLWCNFGAFCISLLTQPTALEQLKG